MSDPWIPSARSTNGAVWLVTGTPATVAGPVVSITVATLAGVGGVTVPGPLASVALNPQVGQDEGDANVIGTLASATLAALPGNLWVPGEVTAITVAALAGAIGTDATIGSGTDANVGLETLVEVAMTPNVVLVAPVGTVYTSNSGPIPGALATIALASGGDVEAYSVDRTGNVINLLVPTPDVPFQPGSLLVSVGNGPPSGTAYFFLDGSTTSFFSVDLDSSGSVLSVTVPIDALAVGVHDLAVGSAVSTPEPTSVTPFTVDEAAVTDTTATPGFPPDITTTHWTFQAFDYDDPMNIPTYEFGFNPNSLRQDFAEVALTATPVIAPGGPTVVWEGTPRPLQWTWTGDVLTKYHHDALVWWSALNSRVWLTDEFLRRYLIKIEALTMTRKRDVDNPWHHTYEMVATILDGAGVLT